MALPLIDQPRDLLLGSDNDLVVGTDLSFSTGVAAVVQSCRVALQMFAGEWFLNLDVGIPYWQEIFAQKPSVAQTAATIAFRSALSTATGVLNVLSLTTSYNPVGRALVIKWQVSTIFGNTPADTLKLFIPTGGS